MRANIFLQAILIVIFLLSLIGCRQLPQEEPMLAGKWRSVKVVDPMELLGPVACEIEFRPD
jgi:hypothetical protein